MNLTPKLADKIAARYDRRDWTGKTPFEQALLKMVERHGLEILDAEARRELILELGLRRRSDNEFSERLRRKNAAIREAQAHRMAAE